MRWLMKTRTYIWLMKNRVYARLYWHLYCKWSKDWKAEKTRLRREGKAWLRKWKEEQADAKAKKEVEDAEQN